LEPFEEYRAYLDAHFSRHLNVQVVGAGIEECPNAQVPEGEFESVVCLNVLEHIDDDVGTLKKCGQLLSPGGRVVILAPALPFIYGAMDNAMGHVRRYTASSLKRRFVEAGLEPQYSRYMNFAGVLGWWWQGRVRRKNVIPEAGTRLFDKCVPYLSAMEKLIPPPVGQSLIMVGKKTVNSGQ
jgi:SAM-dependent methyltransferase